MLWENLWLLYFPINLYLIRIQLLFFFSFDFFILNDDLFMIRVYIMPYHTIKKFLYWCSPFNIWFCYSFIFLLVLRCSNIRLEIFLLCAIYYLSRMWLIFSHFRISFHRYELTTIQKMSCFHQIITHVHETMMTDLYYFLLLLFEFFFVLFSIFLSLLLAIFSNKTTARAYHLMID
jgi:hypothetical protein